MCDNSAAWKKEYTPDLYIENDAKNITAQEKLGRYWNGAKVHIYDLKQTVIAFIDWSTQNHYLSSSNDYEMTFQYRAFFRMELLSWDIINEHNGGNAAKYLNPQNSYFILRGAAGSDYDSNHVVTLDTSSYNLQYKEQEPWDQIAIFTFVLNNDNEIKDIVFVYIVSQFGVKTVATYVPYVDDKTGYVKLSSKPPDSCDRRLLISTVEDGPYVAAVKALLNYDLKFNAAACCTEGNYNTLSKIEKQVCQDRQLTPQYADQFCVAPSKEFCKLNKEGVLHPFCLQYCGRQGDPDVDCDDIYTEYCYGLPETMTQAVPACACFERPTYLSRYYTSLAKFHIFNNLSLQAKYCTYGPCLSSPIPSYKYKQDFQNSKGQPCYDYQSTVLCAQDIVLNVGKDGVVSDLTIDQINKCGGTLPNSTSTSSSSSTSSIIPIVPPPQYEEGDKSGQVDDMVLPDIFRYEEEVKEEQDWLIYFIWIFVIFLMIALLVYLWWKFSTTTTTSSSQPQPTLPQQSKNNIM
jgi:hypothetical protein